MEKFRSVRALLIRGGGGGCTRGANGGAGGGRGFIRAIVNSPCSLRARETRELPHPSVLYLRSPRTYLDQAGLPRRYSAELESRIRTRWHKPMRGGFRVPIQRRRRSAVETLCPNVTCLRVPSILTHYSSRSYVSSMRAYQLQRAFPSVHRQPK